MPQHSRRTALPGLQKVRQHQQLTLQRLSQMTGKTVAALWRLETGQAKANPVTLGVLLAALAPLGVTEEMLTRADQYHQGIPPQGGEQAMEEKSHKKTPPPERQAAFQ